ncbi:hypothetical protein SAMN04490202_5926 [Pseudomonas reinekei]|jgi:hypothetical protein|uniref:SSU ribosomal protein S2p (SAe) n=1 Tax=Pseudomonas reinekei TaxID=395598 RepID=A0A1H0V8P8_PSERE|nr:hypothetical protein [Pseudomonas reinekei]KAB0488738.1 hypothetical protein F7R15_02430 [Pseudomonas reinekei]OLU06233.1 SSU ribosomal protein S2p (SAe) [Pseudomonas reinekei]SDP74466.1 hypothetical protein SAMN04490202_5926 [Pseudomonas reinekei]
MAQPLAFINAQSQTYASLKAQLGLNGIANSKFDALNSHISNSVVLAGELVIIGDVSTPLSTSEEAYLMARARDIHIGLLTNQVDADDFFLDNFELLQGMLAHGAIGAGAVSDGWSKHLAAIKTTLEEIEQAHKDYVRSGSIAARDRFYSERALLFSKLENQIGSVASYGSGLRYQGSIKRMLGISTKRYMSTGEIAGYAQKVSGVAKAAKLIKRGVYIGVALDVASAGLDIRQACALGREDECTRAKYVNGGSLAGGLGGSAVGGSFGSMVGSAGCYFALGIVTGGPGALTCVVIGGAVGGWVAGKQGQIGGEMIGEFLYNMVKK